MVYHKSRKSQIYLVNSNRERIVVVDEARPKDMVNANKERIAVVEKPRPKDIEYIN